MHQQLLHHYEIRIRDDNIEDDDNADGFNLPRESATGDGNRDLATVPGGRDQGASVVVLKPQGPNPIEVDGDLRADKDRRGLGRQGSSSSSSDAAARPHFELITQGEYLRLERAFAITHARSCDY